MALTAPQIKAVWYSFVADLGSTACAFTKADLSAAVSAVDSWATANAASYNSALPEPFKSTATAGQKAALLAYVALARYGKL